MSHPGVHHGTIPAPDRRGVVMFVMLATLAIVGLIAAAMIRGTIAGRRSLRGEHALRQVETLLDAATARAAARLAAGAAADETLDLAAAEIAGGGSARVVVAAEPAGAAAWRVRVVAEYPLEGPVPVRRSRDTLIRSRSSTRPVSEETAP
jgi:hypothetical protein